MAKPGYVAVDERDSEDVEPYGYIFEPPLPMLWSDYEVTDEQLQGCLGAGTANDPTGSEAKALYDSVFKGWKLPVEGAGDGSVGTLVPRHEYGKTGIDMPVISLGGFMSLAVTVMHNRKLRKRTCLIMPLSMGKARPWIICNAILVPLVLVILSCVTPVAQLIFPENLMPKWAAMLICSVVAPAIWILFTQLVFGCCEHPYHTDRLLDFSLSLGVNHIETARHYMESEGQLRPTLKKRRAKGEDWIIQTKIRPYKVAGPDPTQGALYQTAVGKGGSFETLGMADTGVDLLTIHGVNIKAHVESCLDTSGGSSIEQVLALKAEGKAKAVGFAAHCHTDDQVTIIETGKMDYVNLHFGFFSCYHNVDTQKAVLAAAERNMGIYCISPSNQGGQLHEPSAKLIELCAPLHPLEFGLLYLLTHKGIGERGTVSCGPSDPSQFDKQLRALKLVPHAAQLLPPIIKRLRAHARGVLGAAYCDQLARRVGVFTQGNEAMPDAMNLSILMICHGLGKAFDMTAYMKRMGNNMSWPGDWCAGGGLDTLRNAVENETENVDGKEEDPKMVQFRKAIAAQGGDGADNPCGADTIIENLKWMMADTGKEKGKKKKTKTKTKGKSEVEQDEILPWKAAEGGGMAAKKPKGCVGKALGKLFPVMPYVMWWIGSAAKLYGAVPATEHGILDDCWSKVKTKN